MAATTNAVKVALRVRPVNQQDEEKPRGTREVVRVVGTEGRVVVDGRKNFVFDYAFGPEDNQEKVYATCCSTLVEKFVEGYNVTMLAYGQTGSGKTFTMGSCAEYVALANFQDPTILALEGIIPRAVKHIFSLIDKPSSTSKSMEDSHYHLSVTFLEIYNEDLIDLLNQPSQKDKKNNPNWYNQLANAVTIREDVDGRIYWTGAKEVSVTSVNDVLSLLVDGLDHRATSSTDMNRTSSRSHAIFSLTLRQYRYLDNDDPTSYNLSPISPQSSSSYSSSAGATSSGDWSIITSKFHFVDLAGSERLKRTNAVGDRQKEGISINSGLLALGNVIQALSDESGKVTHDSLGGNSETLMIACISPVEPDLAETLNTLKYANRCRNIKNRASVNNSYNSEVRALKEYIAKLKAELAEYQGDGTSDISRLRQENAQLKEKNAALELENSRAKQQNDYLANELSVYQSESTLPLIYSHIMRNKAARASGVLGGATVADPDDDGISDTESVASATTTATIDTVGTSMTTMSGSQLPIPKRFSRSVTPSASTTPAHYRPEDYERAIKRLKVELKETREAAQEYLKQIDNLQSKLNQQDIVLEHNETTINTLEAKVTKFADRDQISTQYITELESRLEASISAAEESAKLVEELKEQVSGLETQNRDAEDYIQGLEMQLAKRDELLETIERLEGELSAANARFETLSNSTGTPPDTSPLRKLVDAEEDEKKRESADKAAWDRVRELEAEVKFLRAASKVWENVQPEEQSEKTRGLGDVEIQEEAEDAEREPSWRDSIVSDITLIGRTTPTPSSARNSVLFRSAGTTPGGNTTAATTAAGSPAPSSPSSTSTPFVSVSSFEALQTKLQESEARYDRDSQDWAQKVETLTAQVSELEAQITHLKETDAERLRIVNALESKLRDAEEGAEHVEFERIEAESQVADMTKAIATTTQNLQEVEAARLHAEKELEAIKQDLSKALLEASEAKAKATVAEQRVGEVMLDAERTRRELETQRVVTEEVQTSTRHALEDKEKELEAAKAAAVQAEAFIAKLKEETREASATIANLRKRLEELEKSSDSIVVELRKELEELRESYEQRLGQALKDASEAQARAALAETQLEEAIKGHEETKERLKREREIAAGVEEVQVRYVQMLAEKSNEAEDAIKAKTELEAAVSRLQAEVGHSQGTLGELRKRVEDLTQDVEQRAHEVSETEKRAVDAEARSGQLESVLAEEKEKVEKASKIEEELRSTAARLQEELEQSQQNVSELRRQVAELGEASETRAKEAEAKVSEATKRADELEAQLDTLKKSHEQAREELEAQHASILQEVQTRSTQLLDERTEEARRLESQISQLQNELRQSQSTISDLRDQLDFAVRSSDKNSSELQQALLDLKAKYSRLQRTEEEQSMATIELTREVVSLQTQLETVHAEHAEKLKGLETTLSERDEKLREESAKLKETAELLEKAMAESRDVANRMEETKQELVSLQKRFEGLQREYQEQSTELEEAIQKLQAAHAEVDEKSIRCGEVSEQLAVAQRELEAKTTQVQEISEKLIAAQHDVADKERTLQEVSEKLMTTQREVDEHSQNAQETSAQLSEAHRELEEKSRKLEEITEQLSAAQQEVEEKARKLQEVLEKLSTAQHEVEEGSRRVQETSEQLSTVQRELKEKSETLQNLSAQVSAQRELDEKLRETSEQLSAARLEIEEKRQKLQETSMELETTREKLADNGSRAVESTDDRLSAAHKNFEEQSQMLQEFLAQLGVAETKAREHEEALQKTIEELEATKEKYEEKKSRLRELEAMYKEQSSTLQETVQQLNVAQTRLESIAADDDQLKLARKEIESLNMLLRDAQDRASVAEDRHEEELHDLTRRLKTVQAESRKYREQLDIVQPKLVDLYAKISERQRQLQQQGDEAQTREVGSREVSEDASNERAVANVGEKDPQAVMADMEQKLSDYVAMIDSEFRGQVDALQQEKEQLQSDLERVNAEKAGLEERIRELEREHEEREKQQEPQTSPQPLTKKPSDVDLDEIKDIQGTTQKAIEGLRKKIRMLEDDLEQERTNAQLLESLRPRLEESEQSRSVLELRIERLVRKLNALGIDESTENVISMRDMWTKLAKAEDLAQVKEKEIQRLFKQLDEQQQLINTQRENVNSVSAKCTQLQEDLAKMTTSNQMASEKLVATSNDLDDARKELRELRAKSAEVQHMYDDVREVMDLKVKDYEARIAELQSTYEVVKSERLELKLAAEERASMVKDLTAQVDAAEMELAEYKKRLGEQSSNVADLLSQVNLARKEQTDHKARADERESTVTKLNATIVDLREQLDVAQKDRTNEKKRADEHEEIASTLENRFSSASNDLETKGQQISVLETQISDLKGEVSELQKEKELYVERVKSLEAEMAEVTKGRDEHAQRATQLEDEISHLQHSLKSIQSERDAERQRAELNHSSAEEVVTRFTALEDQHQNAKQQVAELEQERDSYKSKCVELESGLSSVRAELEQSRAEVEATQTRISELESKCKDLEQKMATEKEMFDAERARGDDSAKELTSREAHLRTSLETAERERDEARKEVEVQQTRVDELQKSLQDLRAQLEKSAIEDSVKDVSDHTQTDQLRVQHETDSATIRTLQSRLSSAEADLNAHEERAAVEEAVVRQLRTQIETLERDLEQRERSSESTKSQQDNSDELNRLHKEWDQSRSDLKQQIENQRIEINRLIQVLNKADAKTVSRLEEVKRESEKEITQAKMDSEQRLKEAQDQFWTTLRDAQATFKKEMKMEREKAQRTMKELEDRCEVAERSLRREQDYQHELTEQLKHREAKVKELEERLHNLQSKPSTKADPEPGKDGTEGGKTAAQHRFTPDEVEEMLEQVDTLAEQLLEAQKRIEIDAGTLTRLTDEVYHWRQVHFQGNNDVAIQFHNMHMRLDRTLTDLANMEFELVRTQAQVKEKDAQVVQLQKELAETRAAVDRFKDKLPSSSLALSSSRSTPDSGNSSAFRTSSPARAGPNTPPKGKGAENSKSRSGRSRRPSRGLSSDLRDIMPSVLFNDLVPSHAVDVDGVKNSAQHHRSRRSTKELTNELVQMREQLSQMERELLTSREEVTFLKNQMVELENVNGDLNEEAEEMRARIYELERDVSQRSRSGLSGFRSRDGREESTRKKIGRWFCGSKTD
ncbi:Kinesin-like protein kif21b [Quaeritorhiza haematococci]|nr:Kinesin-like protein kif21b [Quaeritorhiza haematococci]